MKQFKITRLLFAVILLNSCAFEHYQVHELKTSNNVNDSLMSFRSNGLIISYNFWTNNNYYTCIVENTSDSIITFDLEKSHFIYNKFATPYYSNVTTSTTISITPTLNNTTQINDLTYGFKYSATPEKAIILPPHSKKLLPSFNLTNNYLNCDLKQQENISIINFNQTNTPIQFTNFLYYKIGTSMQWQTTQNDFWVSSITNILEYVYFKHVPEEKCGKQTGYTTRVPILKKENRYFFKAMYTTTN